jgi:hypothetical protein
LHPLHLDRAHRYLRELQSEGRITMGENQNRATHAQRGRSGRNDPGARRVAAGSPILAEEQVEEYIPWNGSTAGLFALRVRGDSMIKCGILNGDIVVVRQTPDAVNGEIVVALVGDDATVKRYYKETGISASSRERRLRADHRRRGHHPRQGCLRRQNLRMSFAGHRFCQKICFDKKTHRRYSDAFFVCRAVLFRILQDGKSLSGFYAFEEASALLAVWALP